MRSIHKMENSIGSVIIEILSFRYKNLTLCNRYSKTYLIMKIVMKLLVFVILCMFMSKTVNTNNIFLSLILYNVNIFFAANLLYNILCNDYPSVIDVMRVMWYNKGNVIYWTANVYISSSVCSLFFPYLRRFSFLFTIPYIKVTWCLSICIYVSPLRSQALTFRKVYLKTPLEIILNCILSSHGWTLLQR